MRTIAVLPASGGVEGHCGPRWLAVWVQSWCAMPGNLTSEPALPTSVRVVARPSGVVCPLSEWRVILGRVSDLTQHHLERFAYAFGWISLG
jgi:hypothetical protein